MTTTQSPGSLPDQRRPRHARLAADAIGRESPGQLAHTGAEETAALAALALALAGTGITLVGLNRRQTA